MAYPVYKDPTLNAAQALESSERRYCSCCVNSHTDGWRSKNAKGCIKGYKYPDCVGKGVYDGFRRIKPRVTCETTESIPHKKILRIKGRSIEIEVPKKKDEGT